MYYGKDASCSYATNPAPNEGSLTSPLIGGIDAGSTLTFSYWREVESANGHFDVTQAQILSDGGTELSTVFHLDSSDPSAAAWTSSGPIPLGQFAGELIRVRFWFDTLDEASNNFTGWLIDDVVVTGSSRCAGGIPCEDVEQLQARCNPVGTLQVRVERTDSSHDGETVTIGVDGTPHVLTISGKVASYQEPGAGVGPHTVTLEDPAGCVEPVVRQCPVAPR